jgi:hypothetical protein
LFVRTFASSGPTATFVLGSSFAAFVVGSSFAAVQVTVCESDEETLTSVRID